MATEIVVDLAQLRETARNIEGKASEYRDNYKRLYEDLDNLKSQWKGADQQAFVTQVEGFRDDCDKMYDWMMGYADCLRKMAVAYQNKVDENVQAAKRLRKDY